MKRDEVLEILAAHRAELERLGVRSLAIFGSVARDEATATSDVDVLVEFHGAATFDGYVNVLSYLEELLGRPIDLLTRRSLTPTLRPLVEKDARYVTGLSAVSG